MRLSRFLMCIGFSLLLLLFFKNEINCFEIQKGETLTYSVRFLYIIPLGTARIEVREPIDYKDRKVLSITCEAKTARWLSLLFKAKAEVISYVDAKYLYPYKFEQLLKVAGKPDDIRRATYDRANNIMDAEGKGKKKVPSDVRDPLSALYYLRTIELREGTEIKQMVNNNQSTYIFNSKVIGKKKVGKFNCWVLDSKIRRENKSMYHSMDAVIYISDDAKHVPVQIQAKTQVGPVTLRLR